MTLLMPLAIEAPAWQAGGRWKLRGAGPGRGHCTMSVCRSHDRFSAERPESPRKSCLARVFGNFPGRSSVEASCVLRRRFAASYSFRYPREAAPPPMQTIQIRGARTHNLKNVDLDLPRDKLIVFTGLSGSG